MSFLPITALNNSKLEDGFDGERVNIYPFHRDQGDGAEDDGVSLYGYYYYPLGCRAGRRRTNK